MKDSDINLLASSEYLISLLNFLEMSFNLFFNLSPYFWGSLNLSPGENISMLFSDGKINLILKLSVFGKLLVLKKIN